MADPRSPLAPNSFPSLPPIAGVRLGSIASGIRYAGRDDLMLIEFNRAAAVAGVFTKSQTAAAPILWCRDALGKGKARALVVNSGNANAFTGRDGDEALARTVAAAAKLVGCPRREVFVSSTGVIGEQLPVDRLTKALPTLRKKISEQAWSDAAAAIMTTDTFPKLATRRADIGGTKVTINGFAKGSGMIAPDMATMLGYVFTDAKIPSEVLQALLVSANDRSFNSITVDGDTSTSDTVLAFATGQASHPKITTPRDAALKSFRAAFDDIMIDLAQQIVRDGEGATKFVTVTVTGAASARAARKIALTIGNSPLVKTAISGEDANWGRVVMAVGKSGQRADRDRLEIKMGGVKITENGQIRDDYDETPVAEHMKGDEVLIEVDVGIGKGRATIWTCDLTHGYININADYRS
ncbi:MAG: bifunctional glutamate N-acetyltransferase/amino-acid acetyltransferase ArgJ [Pseudomonadota bacterium]|nr:bifunctional glutamate N-acetyltransferase/amino-acid acetyltransferase ArgJ [Pseudomonadota bacterium]